MEIEYKGATGLIIKSGPTTVVVDPKLSLVGLKDLKVSDCVEVATDNALGIDSDQKILINGPGEYEVSGVAIRGVAVNRYRDNSDKKSTIYKLEIAGQRIAILGHTQEPLDEAQLEYIGLVDILLIPVGGNNYTLDGHTATKITNQIDPRIIVPMHYEDKGIKYDVTQDALTNFLKELSPQEHEIVDKLKIKNGILPVVRTVYEVRRS